MYVPSVTSPLTLTLTQSSSLMQMHNSPAAQRYLKLLHIPTKNPAGACDLAYIIHNINELKNEFVDVIVAVTFVSNLKKNLNIDLQVSFFFYFLISLIGESDS